MLNRKAWHRRLGALTRSVRVAVILLHTTWVASRRHPVVNPAKGQNHATRGHRTSLSWVMLLLACLPARSVAAQTVDNGHWAAARFGAGLNGTVNAVVTDAAGALYAAGDFTTAGDITANRIAKWDGAAWHPLGDGFNDTVHALAVDANGNLYAGGEFTKSGTQPLKYIARWNGAQWEALGPGMNFNVYALTVDRTGKLYAGGFFTLIGNLNAAKVAMWDGSKWSALGGGLNSTVNALATDSTGKLYAGGSFTNYIAQWDGVSWSTVGGGVSNLVNALVVDSNDQLYAGGVFATAGGTAVGNVAKWSGSQWSALTTGVNRNVTTLQLDAMNRLYVGGAFTRAGGVTVGYLAQWNGSQWTTLGSGVNNTVETLGLDGGKNLLVGGDFTLAGAVTAPRLASWSIPYEVTGQFGKQLAGVAYDRTPVPTYAPLGVITMNYQLTNRSANTLRHLYYVVQTANKANLMNPSNGVPTGAGAQITVADSILPGGDNRLQPNETLSQQSYRIGVTGSGWLLVIGIYAATDLGRSSQGTLLDQIILDSRDFSMSPQPVYLPLIQQD